jgi:hypothetical protein
MGSDRSAIFIEKRNNYTSFSVSVVVHANWLVLLLIKFTEQANEV